MLYQDSVFKKEAAFKRESAIRKEAALRNDSARRKDSIRRKDPAPQAFSLRVVRNRCHDEFERRVEECTRLAAAARNDRDRAFWLSLVARWQVVESRRPILVPRRPARLRVAVPEG